METAEAAIKLISEGAVLLTDEKQKEFFEKILNSLKKAKVEANNEEKEARYIDASVKYANQISFILFRNGTLSDELEAALRELPTPEDTAAKVAEFNNARQARIDEINKQHQAIFDEEKDLDVFTGIIAGLSKGDAEKRMAEHEAKIREASKQM